MMTMGGQTNQGLPHHPMIMWRIVIGPLTYTMSQKPLEYPDSQIPQTCLTCNTCEILNSQNGWKGEHAFSLFFVLDNPNLPSSDIISNLISCVLAQTSPFQLGFNLPVRGLISLAQSVYFKELHRKLHMI